MNDMAVLPELELRQYRYFAVLAQELHFARAAERLDISQPALSQQLRLIERRVGAPLLERNRRHVELTEVGMVLQEQALLMLAQMQQSQRAVAQAVSGGVGCVEIGYVASAALSGVLPRLVYQYRQERPAVQVVLREMDMLEQLEAIAAGRLDVGFIRPPIAQLPDGLSMFDLLVEPMMAVLRSSHPLAGQSRIQLEDLQSETFICTHRRVLCHHQGTVPASGLQPAHGSVFAADIDSDQHGGCRPGRDPGARIGPRFCAAGRGVSTAGRQPGSGPADAGLCLPQPFTGRAGLCRDGAGQGG